MGTLIKLVFCLLLSINTYAEVCEKALKENQEYNDLTKDVEKSINIIKKPFSAATEDQVLNAQCKRKPPSAKEMIKILNKERKDKQKVELNGFTFKNEDPSLVLSLSDLINKRKDIYDTEGSILDLKNDKFLECKDATCIAEKVFGEELGPKLLFLKHKFGLNGSQLVYKESRKWGAKELDPFIQGVYDMPSYIFPMDLNRPCIHDNKDNGSIVANSTIIFYDGIDKFSGPRKNYTMFHELSHYIGEELEIDKSPQWLELSNWKTDLIKKHKIEQELRDFKDSKPKPFSLTSTSTFNLTSSTNSYGLSSLSSLGKPKEPFTMMEQNRIDNDVFNHASITDQPDKIISRFGQTNPSEDFAESITAYRYNPKELKKIAPEKYNFIKNKIFAGVEFDKEENCNEKNSIIAKHLSKLAKWKKKKGKNLTEIPKEIQDDECYSLSDSQCLKKRKRAYEKQLYVESLDISSEKKTSLLKILQAYSQ
jgi:hypothetical protein